MIKYQKLPTEENNGLELKNYNNNQLVVYDSSNVNNTQIQKNDMISTLLNFLDFFGRSCNITQDLKKLKKNLEIFFDQINKLPKNEEKRKIEIEKLKQKFIDENQEENIMILELTKYCNLCAGKVLKYNLCTSLGKKDILSRVMKDTKDDIPKFLNDIIKKNNKEANDYILIMLDIFVKAAFEKAAEEANLKDNKPRISTIMVWGIAGSGKSSLLKIMGQIYNWINSMGPIQDIVTQEIGTGTVKVEIFTVHYGKVKLILVDVPGFQDALGQQGKDIVKNIKQLNINLESILFTIKVAHLKRGIKDLEKTLNNLIITYNIEPKLLWEKVIVVFTFTNKIEDDFKSINPLSIWNPEDKNGEKLKDNELIEYKKKYMKDLLDYYKEFKNYFKEYQDTIKNLFSKLFKTQFNPGQPYQNYMNDFDNIFNLISFQWVGWVSGHQTKYLNDNKRNGPKKVDFSRAEINPIPNINKINIPYEIRNDEEMKLDPNYNEFIKKIDSGELYAIEKWHNSYMNQIFMKATKEYQLNIGLEEIKKLEHGEIEKNNCKIKYEQCCGDMLSENVIGTVDCKEGDEVIIILYKKYYKIYKGCLKNKEEKEKKVYINLLIEKLDIELFKEENYDLPVDYQVSIFARYNDGTKNIKGIVKSISKDKKTCNVLFEDILYDKTLKMTKLFKKDNTVKLLKDLKGTDLKEGAKGVIISVNSDYSCNVKFNDKTKITNKVNPFLLSKDGLNDVKDKYWLPKKLILGATFGGIAGSVTQGLIATAVITNPITALPVIAGATVALITFGIISWFWG